MGRSRHIARWLGFAAATLVVTLLVGPAHAVFHAHGVCGSCEEHAHQDHDHGDPHHDHEESRDERPAPDEEHEHDCVLCLATITPPPSLPPLADATSVRRSAVTHARDRARGLDEGLRRAPRGPPGAMAPRVRV